MTGILFRIGLGLVVARIHFGSLQSGPTDGTKHPKGIHILHRLSGTRGTLETESAVFVTCNPAVLIVFDPEILLYYIVAFQEQGKSSDDVHTATKPNMASRPTGTANSMSPPGFKSFLMRVLDSNQRLMVRPHRLDRTRESPVAATLSI